MPTGAAPQVGDRFLARPSPDAGAPHAAPSTRMTLTWAVATGLVAAVALASCRPSRPAAPAAADATAPAPAPHLAAAPEFPPPAPPRGTEIAIGYSSNLLGEYEPCG